jgi:hypothetical protein
MDWLLTAFTLLIVIVLLAPVLMIGLTVFVLAPLAHLARQPAMIGRRTFDCPFSKRRATVEFVASPDAARPEDVRACSVFPDGHVRCDKACRELAEAAWAPPPAVARWALLAGDTAYR